MKDKKKPLQALSQIAQIANDALAGVDGGETSTNNGHDNDDGHDHEHSAGCTVKALPARLATKAAEVAARINPVNRPFSQASAEIAVAVTDDPQALTLLTTKYWGPMPRRLTVSFLEATATDLRNRIISHMNAWNSRCGISFVYTAGRGQVRISRAGSGYWSYLGTDILLIPANQPTMNLQGFSMNTSESEYRRVVRHETGHTLGFPHEHLRAEIIRRIVPAKAYAYFLRMYGWNKAMVDNNVLTPLSAGSIFGTPVDQTSIMCYQLPGEITSDGRPITGGTDINATDYAFAASIYPKLPGFTLSSASATAPAEGSEWSESDDVTEQELEAAIQSVNKQSQVLEEAG